MFKHDLAPADASTVREAVEATTRWSPSLARNLAHFGTECVYRDVVSQALLFGPQPEIARRERRSSSEATPQCLRLS
jgi:hypothetical protein